MFESKNMSYIYYHEYFEGLKVVKEEKNATVFELKEVSKGKGKFKTSEEQFRERNKALQDFEFDLSMSPLKDLPNIQTFSLTTVYPGLMIGIGNPHDLKSKGSLYSGFSFDYVTGLPYIPGSSVKGVLKSVFPTKEDTEEDINIQKMGYIKSILSAELTDEQIYELKDNIFENNDAFLDAYPCPTSKNKTQQKCLALEFITPHSDIIKNPIPINCLKIKPGVSFTFAFYLKDSHLSDGINITVDQKLKLFKTILTDIGIGAKTNVGFGQLVE